MSNSNEDRTVAFQDHTVMEGDHGRPASGMVEAPSARLICIDTSQIEGNLPGDGQITLVAGAEQTVGRGETCTYPIPSRKLSRQHARVFPGVGAWGVEDLNSTNGVQVNRQKVTTSWLRDGDEVRFGPIPFRFEVLRADATAAGRTAPSGGEESEDRTMMVGSLAASKAVIEAERKSEPEPPVTEAVRPAMQAQTTQRAGGGSRMILIVAVIVIVAGLAAGAAVYYPTFVRNQEISDVVGRSDATITRIIKRMQEGDATRVSSGEMQRDVEWLQPVNAELRQHLDRYPDEVTLANTYARSRFLVFERAFRATMDNNDLGTAERQANTLRRSLMEIEAKLPDSVADKERQPLTDSIRLAELAATMIGLRRFTQRFPNLGQGADGTVPNRPTEADIRVVERLKEGFENLRRSLNQVMTRDFRLFFVAVQEIDQRDLIVISRWREFMRRNR